MMGGLIFWRFHSCIESPNTVSLVVVLSVSVLILGCSSDEIGVTIPVSGKVVLKEVPIKAGSVTFYPDKAKNNKTPFVPTGTISETGTYTLSIQGKDGAPAGWYKVVVNATVPSNPKDPYSTPKMIAPKKYSQEATTDLSVEVKPGGMFDLKLN